MRNKLMLGMLVLGVFLLHQDFWNWRKTEPLVFGCLPVGLAYHIGFAILAAIMMALLVKFAWPKELNAMESSSETSSKEDKR